MEVKPRGRTARARATTAERKAIGIAATGALEITPLALAVAWLVGLALGAVARDPSTGGAP